MIKRQAPRFCVADKNSNQVFVGDRIRWWTDSYLYPPGRRIGRVVRGNVLAITQKIQYNWRDDTTSLVTKLKVRADKNSYGDYDYGTVVTLSNLNNIEKLVP